MAATIIEDEQTQETETTERLDDNGLTEYTDEEQTLESQQTETTQDTHEEETEQPEELPEKYKGKSLQDVVKMHQEAEKAMGRQSSEVGELRKVVDDYISSTIQPNEDSTQQQQYDEVDFYTDPQSAVDQAIARHPKIKAAEEVTQAFAKQNAMAQLQANHPDMQQILSDDKFAEWIKGSKIRTQLFVQADQGYDAEAANELFTLWKERKGAINQAVEAEKAGRQQAVKNGATGNARGNPDSQSSKKYYRRAEIINLMKNDPDRYMALQDDIMRAYAEKRVR